jgi:hypothetical protein
MAIQSRIQSGGEEAPYMRHHDPYDNLPDVRDGLTSRERLVLRCLHELLQERGGRHVPTGTAIPATHLVAHLFIFTKHSVGG